MNCKPSQEYLQRIIDRHYAHANRLSRTVIAQSICIRELRKMIQRRKP